MSCKISAMKILMFLFFFLVQSYRSQNLWPFPEPMKTSTEYLNRGEFTKAIQFNVGALKKYNVNNDTEGISGAYINIAAILFTLGKLEDSTIYLDKAKEFINESDYLSWARFYGEYARIYAKLKLPEKSEISFDKALYYANKIEDKKQKTFVLYYLYFFKVRTSGKENSLKNIDRKMLNSMNSAIGYSVIANSIIDQKQQLDSAAYYLNKAVLAPDYKEVIRLQGTTSFSYGNLYNIKGDYNQSLDYYQKSLAIFQKLQYKTNIRATYDSIASVYDRMGDIKMSNKYLKKFKEIDEAIEHDEKRAVNLILNKSVNLEKEKKRQEKEQLYFIFAGCFVLLLVTVAALFHIQRQKQLNKENLLEEQTLENMQLKKQLNASADQLIQLAETNNPSFLAQFKETYPDFIEQLLSYQENLSEYELKLSAYIRLGLSTKQIAQYEIIAIRTAENRKYRLKKKLKLDSDISLNKWILEL